MAMPDMGKMLGPLPLGAWLAVVGGGLAVALYTRQQGSATAPGTVADTSTDPGVGTGGSGLWTDIGTPTTPTGSVAAPTTNEEWGVRAINYLTGTGYPGIMADQAIRKYLAGESLGVSEVSMVSAAIRELGSTPQILPPPIVGIPGPVIPPNPPPASTPARKPYTAHTVRPTQTLEYIALSYKKPLNQLWSANNTHVVRLDGTVGILTSYKVKPGQVLIIPWTNQWYLKKI